jgi:hypothetical protein
LCEVGVCEVENRPSGPLPDSDNDGIPDDADNCPGEANSDQADSDLDLVGDICDPFPDDRDNEQAQCEVDRDQALSDLEQCQSEPRFADADGDGEHDQTDLCPGTAPGSAVDTAGCSLTQFCSPIDVSTGQGRQTCRISDWSNDEPGNNPRDCMADRTAGLCVPVAGALPQGRQQGGSRLSR